MSIFPADVANSNATPITDTLIRQQVEDLLTDYAHALDDFELDRWPDFFTEDGIYQIIPRESYDQNLPLGILFCDGRGMMVDRILALRTANIFEPHTNSHITGRPKLSQSDDGTINARSNFNITRTMQDGRMEIYATGKYVDVITFVGGKPLFKDRRVVLDPAVLTSCWSIRFDIVVCAVSHLAALDFSFEIEITAFKTETGALLL